MKMLKDWWQNRIVKGYTALILVVALAIVVNLAWKLPAQLPTNITLTNPPIIPLYPSFEFPNGGRSLFPGYRLVALYGVPNQPAFGALGHQHLHTTLIRTQKLAASYQALSKVHILPTLEIITTIASGSPTANHDYSIESDALDLLPWILAAQKYGIYVVLDLQPGRTNFLTQAKNYQSLLIQPNVGLALDPEWRLKPNQVHLKQIGSVESSEINDTSAWLADLVHQYQLPQKLFLIQQFRLSMIDHRDQLNTTHPELAYVIQMDGNGKQSVKDSTWQLVTQHPPANLRFGWKNFYKQDHPLLTPNQVMRITPTPWYVSYQ